MTVNKAGKVTEGIEPEPQISEVRTRQATPEELAELDAAINRKYGKAEQQRDRRKAKAELFANDVMERSRHDAAKRRKEKQLNDEYMSRLKECCQGITRERWEAMRAFVVVAGAFHGWNEGMENAEAKD